MKDTGMTKNPKGKIYAKYYNSMRTLRACSLIIPVNKSLVKTISHNRYDQQEFGNIYLLLLLYRVYQIVCDSMTYLN